MKSKRKFDRPSMVATLEVTVPGRKTRTKGYAINVSCTGIGVYIQDLLTVGEEVTITITYMEGVGFPAFETVSGTVKWCKGVGGRYAAGIEFLQLDPKDHSMLLSYLKMTEEYREV